jgi:hypothetical protein
MRYLMLVCVDPEIELTGEETASMAPRTEAWLQEVEGRGVRTLGNRLAATTDATTVRVRDGEVVIADGPFAETKEFIAGFDILECADLDEAIEVAAKHPCAINGALEIRPFWEG